MALTNGQRLDRLRVRADELSYWTIREGVDVTGWTIDGVPTGLGGAWPSRQGVHTFAATAEVPTHWPLEDTRLYLDLGGEGLVTLSYPNRDAVSFGVDPYHREFPLRHRQVAITAEATAREPFGVPVRDPRLTRAVLQWNDAPVRRLVLLLAQIVESVDALRTHEVVPHLLTAAENCLRSLDWPSATADYLARVAPSHQQQQIWELPPSIDPAPALDQGQRASVAAAYDALLDELKALQERYPSVRTEIPPGEAALVERWDEDGLSFLATGQSCPRFGFTGLLLPGTECVLGDRPWQVHAAPGHDPHSIILFDALSRTLISADALWEHGFGIAFPELAGEPSFGDMAATLDLIESLAPLRVVPGHGAVFDDVGKALSVARKRLDGLQRDPVKHARH
eukprot:gene34660-46523_t